MIPTKQLLPFLQSKLHVINSDIAFLILFPSRYENSPYGGMGKPPFDIGEIRQTLATALCVSPITLMMGPVSSYLGRLALLDLFQVSFVSELHDQRIHFTLYR